MGPVRMQARHSFVGGGVTARLMVLLLALAGDAAGAAALARVHCSGVEEKRSKMKEEPLGGDAARAASRDLGTANPPNTAAGLGLDDAEPASARPGAAARAEPAAADGERQDAARHAMHGSGDGEPSRAGGSGQLSQRGAPALCRASLQALWPIRTRASAWRTRAQRSWRAARSCWRRRCSLQPALLCVHRLGALPSHAAVCLGELLGFPNPDPA